MGGNDSSSRRRNSSAVFKVGAISLVFLILGYEAALFVHRAASLRVRERRDSPDTVYVIDSALAASLLDAGGEAGAAGDFPARQGPAGVSVRRNAAHHPEVQRQRAVMRPVECFRFDPNTVSVEDLERLGFSEKQALSIDAYRRKGGRFRRKADFAKSYVVADSVYRRLEPYISIPRTDINKADSAAFDALPGIGPYFAAKMVEYREKLGGYSFPEQLLDIWNFDEEKYAGLSDLITCSAPARPLRLWTMDADALKAHPYVGDYRTARSIVLWRENTPVEAWNVENLCSAGILTEENAAKLRRCAVEEP